MDLVGCLKPVTVAAVQQRGVEYVRAVRGMLGGISGVTAGVRGSEDYHVSMRVAEEGLVVSCTCPYFYDQGAVCKHLWAVALAASTKGWLRDIPPGLPVIPDLDDDIFDSEPPWPRDAAESRFSGHGAAPPVVSRRPAPWESVLASVMPGPRGPVPAVLPGAELLYVILAPTLAWLTELPIHVERRERKRDGIWGKPQPARLATDMVDTLPDADDRWALSLLHAASPYARAAWSQAYSAAPPVGAIYVKAPMTALVIPRLCATGRMRLRQAKANVLPLMRSDGDVPLSWDDGPAWRFRLIVTGSRETEYRVTGILTREGLRHPLDHAALLMDGLAIIDGVASRCDPNGGAAWIAQLRARPELVVPGGAQRGLREAIVRSGVQDVTLPDDLAWENRITAPLPRLMIGSPHPHSGACPLVLEFAYEHTLAPDDGASAMLSDAGDVLYQRDRMAEHAALGRLKQLGASGIEPHLSHQPFIHQRRIVALVHALVSEGWHVEAEGLRYRTVAAPRIHIRSGIDWFELEAVTGDGLALEMPAVLQALARGQRTITLGDGSIGVLPEDWLASVAPALSLADATADGLRFRPSQAALVEAMLAAGQSVVDWDAGFTKARERLQGFAGVGPEDAPATFVGTLRGYQREALGWLRFLRDFGFGGCLADDMGLGKTVVVLALVESRRLDTTRDRRPSLVVVPRSLVFNWISEAARFTPALRVLDFAGADRHTAGAAVADVDIVLTTYGTLRRDVARLQSHVFDYVILDEAQAIKNQSTATAKAVRLLRADHRLALTGTPVENHIGELHSLFEFLNPGLLGSGRLFDRARGASIEDPAQVEAVARGLRPFILRRTKDQVAPELPPRTEETLFCELEGKERAIYDELRDHYRRGLLRTVDRDGITTSRCAILEALLRLRQAACHPALLPRTGPPAGTSAKFDLLLPRLTELISEGRKALVFSQFTSLLALLRPRLEAAGLVYEYLDGKTRDRAARVERFQRDPACPLFLISLKAGGTGLNLTAAESVFLLDPWWNPAVEMQAVDRTHRIGQTRPVFAYRLVARNTVEERILELQARKRALADAILTAGEGGLRGLTREDVSQLLS